MKTYFFLFLAFVSNSFFSQSNINSKISNLYDKLNYLKQETRKIEKEINDVNTENLSSRWIFRKDFIVNNNRTSIKAIESSIEIIPSIKSESEQIIWCGKIENMMNEYKEFLYSSKDKLITDIEVNTIIITKSNLKTIAYDDLVLFLLNKTGKTESQIKSLYQQESNKYGSFRNYIEKLVDSYLK